MKTQITNLIAALSTTLTTVGIQFKDANGLPFGRTYTYKTDLELKVGDEVVVDAPSTGLTVVVVSEVHTLADIDANAAYKYKWVVTKVDLDAHEERLAKEDELAEEFAKIQQKVTRMRKIKELKEALGFSEDQECEELSALLAKINAQ